MKTTSKATNLLLILTVGVFGISAAQADLKEELREKLQNMEQKARKLKEDGKSEEFEKIKQEMKDFVQKARQRHAEEMRAEKMKSDANARDKAKAESDEKSERKEKEKLHEQEERAAHERKMMMHREEMEKKGDRAKQAHDHEEGQDHKVAEAKMKHLEQAAEHLRAAGKPELANQILKGALDENRKAQIDHKPSKEARAPQLSPELAQRIGNQFKEMHEALRRLNERLERLEKAARH